MSSLFCGVFAASFSLFTLTESTALYSQVRLAAAIHHDRMSEMGLCDTIRLIRLRCCCKPNQPTLPLHSHSIEVNIKAIHFLGENITDTSRSSRLLRPSP